MSAGAGGFSTTTRDMGTALVATSTATLTGTGGRSAGAGDWASARPVTQPAATMTALAVQPRHPLRCRRYGLSFIPMLLCSPSGSHPHSPSDRRSTGASGHGDARGFRDQGLFAYRPTEDSIFELSPGFAGRMRFAGCAWAIDL